VKIRLDAATVEQLRKSGPGWQTRVNAALGVLVIGKDGCRRILSVNGAAVALVGRNHEPGTPTCTARA